MTKLKNTKGETFAFFKKFTIRGTKNDDIYMERWRLVDVPWFGVYVHKISRPDADPELHDHPWGFVSFILWGGYDELCGLAKYPRLHWRRSHRPGQMNLKKATDLHRIGYLWADKPCWTLVFRGRRVRQWGFVDFDGQWIEAQKFFEMRNYVP